MAFLKQLSEKLEAQKIYDGMMGKYETRFKVEGFEYALLATSMGGDYDDNTNWMLEFENIKAHRIGSGDNNKAIAKSFAEAVDVWVKEKNPMSFYTYGSNIESLQSIIEAVKKKVKKYNLIDDTAEKKNEENGEVIEGNPVGKITWSKILEQEASPALDRDALESDKFEPPYEDPKDIKTDKAFLSGDKKSDKLDKGEGSYDLKTEGAVKKDVKEESFKQFKARMLEESVGLSPDQNKQNIVNFLRIASEDMKEVIETSERSDEDKLSIVSGLDLAIQELAERSSEAFADLQGYTGDKIPEFTDKKIFGILQNVIGSQEGAIGTAQEIAAGVLAKLDILLAGEFQPSAVLDIGKKKEKKEFKGVSAKGLPSRDFLNQRMKELGMSQ